MRLFLFAVVLIIAVSGCSDGKLNLLLVFWGDSEESSSSRERSEPESSSSLAKLSSSSAAMSSSSEETPQSSSSEEPPPSSSSSSEDVQPPSSGSRGVRSSSAKTDSNGNTYVDYPALEEGAPGVKKGWASRYWDGCKPHCSWYENIYDFQNNKYHIPPWANSWTICKNCDVKNNEMPTWFEHPNTDQWWQGYLGTASGCEPKNMDLWVKSSTYQKWQADNPTYPVSPAYTCWDMAPIAVNDTLAYGFVAANSSVAECGACYQLEFDGNWHSNSNPRPTNRMIKGKTMIVMVSNIGGEVELDQFDILIPGGGTGRYKSFSEQLGIKDADWKMGQEEVTFGGLLNNCLYNGINMVLDLHGDDAIRDGSHRATLQQWQECLRTGCKRIFSNKAKELYDGCLWHAEWFYAADNPTLVYKEVPCPQYLIDKYKSKIDLEPPSKYP